MNLLTANFWQSLSWLEPIAALLTIVAIPYAILYTLIRLIYKAKHRIYFAPKETYQEVKLLNHPSEPQSLWLQVMVKNQGFEISRQAEVYLSEIWKKEEKKLSRVRDFRAPVKLKWAHEAGIFPIDILPRESRRLDVCFICEGENILRLMVKEFPSGSIQGTLEPGEYVFKIRAVSGNGLLPTTFFFQVNWDGKWKTLCGATFLKSFRLRGAPVKSFVVY